MCVEMKDILIYQQSNQTIQRGSPLYDVLKDRQLLQYFGDDPVLDSSNMRGYVCEWTIIDGELYLTKFHSRSIRLHKIAQIFGTEPIYDLTEENVRNIDSFDHDETTHIKADWFSGTIVAYDCPIQKKPLNRWQYTFQEGKLVDEKSKCVGMTQYKLDAYIED